MAQPRYVPMSYLFRQMEMIDVLGTLMLEQAYFEDNYSYHNELLTYLLNPGLSFICIEEEKIVGIVKTEVLGSDSKASICVLCVSLQHRRRGIARRLVELTVEAVKGKKIYNSVELHVSTSNRAAIGLYESLGFRSVETVPRLYSNSFPAYKMILNISKLEW